MYQLTSTPLPNNYQIHPAPADSGDNSDINTALAEFMLLNRGSSALALCKFYAPASQSLLDFLLASIAEKLGQEVAAEIIVNSGAAPHNGALDHPRLSLSSHILLHNTPLSNPPQVTTTTAEQQGLTWRELEADFLQTPQLQQFLMHSDGHYSSPQLSATRFGNSRNLVILGAEDAQGLACLGLLHQSHPKNDSFSIEIVGVRQDLRGHGLGKQLHARLMQRASQLGTSYSGMTDADNLAMQAIMRANGCQFSAEQWSYLCITAD